MPEPPAAVGEPRSPKRSKSTVNSVVELVLIVVIAVGLAVLIQAFVIKPYKIPSGSMEPTLAVGQRILVDRIGNALDGPRVGEIAVFHPPRWADQSAVCGPHPHKVAPGGEACASPVAEEDTSTNFIKRIVAGPGDVIAVREGHVYRNGKRESDPYIRECGRVPECNFPAPIKIPPGHWFMMGDNRGDSDDSRFWGPVPTSWIIGSAFFTYWPIDRIGGL
ncbi:MAG TPA: signal peptidase I [Solirubrobacteraceae bacterium]|jgi:signal peptidase I